MTGRRQTLVNPFTVAALLGYSLTVEINVVTPLQKWSCRSGTCRKGGQWREKKKDATNSFLGTWCFFFNMIPFRGKLTKKKKGTTRGNKYYISDCSCDKILIRDSLIWYWYWSDTIVRMINLTLCNNSLRHVGGISMISVPDDQCRLRQGPYLSLSILF